MRRASVIVLLLTFLALIGGTLAVPARSAGLVWTISPMVLQSPEPSSANADVPGDLAPIVFGTGGGESDEERIRVDDLLFTGVGTPAPKAAADAAQAQTAVAFTQLQSTIALGVGQPDLHWQPLWMLWPQATQDEEFTDPPEDFVVRTAGVPQVVMSSDFLQDWTVDKQAWAIQLGLILALGGLLFLVLRIVGARREANRDHAPVAAR